jgi:MSHA pilin protein MshC
MTGLHINSGARAGGFTLIELVTILVIAGVLAAIGGPHFFSQAVFTQRGFADELAGAFRLAQKVAVASDCPTQITLTASTYVVKQQLVSNNTCKAGDTTWTTSVVTLDGATLAGSAPSGSSISPTGVYVFGGAGVLTSSPATSISVGVNTITIDATTGYVQEN